MNWGRGDGFRMIQAHYIYCALNFYYYYISSSSDHQALDALGTPAKTDLIRARGSVAATCAGRPLECRRAESGSGGKDGDSQHWGSGLCSVTTSCVIFNKSHELSSFDKTESEGEDVSRSVTLCNPTGCSLPGPSVHEILQARILEWVAIPFSRGSPRPRDQTLVSSIAERLFTLASKNHKEIRPMKYLVWHCLHRRRDSEFARQQCYDAQLQQPGF